MEKPLIWKKLVDSPITKIEIMPDTKLMLVVTESLIKTYRIKRGVKA